LTKTARKKRVNNGPAMVLNPRETAGRKPQAAFQTYDASRHIARDLKWSGITAGVVIIVLVIFYIWLH
jgi:hypothetical protein